MEAKGASFVVAMALMVAIQSGTPAWASGRLGHHVIAQIAERRLTPKAREAVKAILPDGESVADASSWADENRRRLPKTAPWHYAEVPLDEPAYGLEVVGRRPNMPDPVSPEVRRFLDRERARLANLRAV